MSSMIFFISPSCLIGSDLIKLLHNLKDGKFYISSSFENKWTIVETAPVLSSADPGLLHSDSFCKEENRENFVEEHPSLKTNIQEQEQGRSSHMHERLYYFNSASAIFARQRPPASSQQTEFFYAYLESPIMWPPKKGEISATGCIYSTASPSSTTNAESSPAWGHSTGQCVPSCST